MTVDDVLNDLQESGIEVKSVKYYLIHGGRPADDSKNVMYNRHTLRFNHEMYLRVLNEVGKKSLQFSIDIVNDEADMNSLKWPISMRGNLFVDMKSNMYDFKLSQRNWPVLLKALKRMLS